MFYLDVYENVPDGDPINIQHREYSGFNAPSECTDAMKKALEYYRLKAMAIDIVMSDKEQRLIAKIELNP